MSVPEVRVRSWVRGTEAELRSGLVGYVSFHVGDLVVDGVTLRVTSDRRFALSWPARTDRAGRRHPFIRPVDDDARRAIERMVFAELGQRDDLGAAEQEADDA